MWIWIFFFTAQAHCEKMFFLVVWAVLSFHCLAHRVSGQVLRTYSIVSLSRTVGPCTLQGGRWIGQWMTTWSTICSSAPHSQNAEGVMCHLCCLNLRHSHTFDRWALSGADVQVPWQSSRDSVTPLRRRSAGRVAVVALVATDLVSISDIAATGRAT